MAHYKCPDCGTRSDERPTKAEVRELLATHQKYFCRPRLNQRRNQNGPKSRRFLK